MTNRQRTWMWLSTAVSVLAGVILVWNDSNAGWFLIIMGAVYLGMLTRPGQALTASKPDLVRWGLIGTLLLVVSALVLVVIIVLK